MTDEPDDKILLTPNNIVGILQRTLGELNAYLSQAPHAIDANVCMAALSEMASWVNRLPAPGTMMPPEKAGDEARAN